MGERRCQKAAVWIAIGLIAVHALLLIWSALSNSVMFDETAHLPAGCSYLRYRDFSVDNYNPPLVQMLAAAPVMLARPVVPDPFSLHKTQPAARIWLYAMTFERANQGRFQKLFEIGRLGLLPVTCLGAWIVFAWARRLYDGAAPALAACAMWILEPDILAHGSLVGTDLAVAIAMLLALWMWIRFCQGPTTGRALAAGLAIAAAHLCKLTALLLWPTFAVLLLVTFVRQRNSWRQLLVGYILCIILTFALLNLCYGYRHTFYPLADFDFRSNAMLSLQHRFGWLPSPIPGQLLLGIDSLKWECEAKFRGFLLGQTYMGGRWDYYPVALAAKLPLSILALLLMAIVSMFWPGQRVTTTSREWLLLVGTLAVAVGMAMGWELNIGVRHLLPLYPLAILLTARLWTLGRGVRFVGWTMLVILAIESFSVVPLYLTFFNILAGGPSQGWKVTNDSNFDWGQGLLDLEHWQDEHHPGRIELAYFGMVDPQTYGIDYVPFGEGTDEPFVAVSSYFLVGQRQRSRSTHGGPQWVTVDCWQKLEQMKPVAVPGGTIFIFTRQQFESAKQ
jgi:Dolichyl-phosphate-mannose-protein mannosyltransferase